MSRHFIKTMIAFVCFALVGVFGVWITHYLDHDTSPVKSKQTEKESVTSVINAVILRISK